jgi:hypothetical protein
MMSHEIWVSPNGVRHLVPVVEDRGPIEEPVTSPCATCGMSHNVLHFRNIRVFEVTHLGPCVIVQLPDYPYECGLKDKFPDARVYSCTTHRVWWTEEPVT